VVYSIVALSIVIGCKHSREQRIKESMTGTYATRGESMQSKKGISFGDHVRVKPSIETEKAGLSNKTGLVYGETTPSITGVEVIGQLSQDYAINVHFEDIDKGFWFSEELIKFVDHAPGTTASIGRGPTFVRNETGEWIEQKPTEKRHWWPFRKKR
jgi:hypothetical protein